MSKRNIFNRIYIWVPLMIAAAVALGIIVGSRFHKQGYIGDGDRKINTILNLINDQYADTVNIGDLVEMTIPKMLAGLDPHSVYIPASDVEDVNGELEGSFSGIGVSFQVMNDTVTVVEVVPNGPSEKVGILTGDRIIAVDDSTLIGVQQSDVMKRLRGPKGTKVKLSIKRNTSTKPLTFEVTRSDIPVQSIDAYYFLSEGVAYIKVNMFGRHTYEDFLNVAFTLERGGAKSFVIDLRGNGGGLLDVAMLMANEFLEPNRLIVYTKGREHRVSQEYWSDGTGAFRNAEVVVLIDEFSASASEVFAGALQDNDRGLIIGRRSFGKGLIQQQFSLPDKSAVRLTIGRYYTPSGRCIQKQFKPGDENGYTLEVYDRFSRGEAYNKDSIKVDKEQVFHTSTGRTVYGGGGIIPDIFVPNDTTHLTNYYFAVANAGLLQKFAFAYTDINRKELDKVKSAEQLLKLLPPDDVLLDDFVSYAAENGIPKRWYYINISKPLIVNQLKALIVRDVYDMSHYYEVYNATDKVVQTALKSLKSGKARFPIMPERSKTDAKKK